MHFKSSHIMRKKTWKKLLSSSYVSVKNKTYINFVLVKTAHFILHIEKKPVWKSCFGSSNAVFKHQKLIQMGKTMPRMTQFCCK